MPTPGRFKQYVVIRTRSIYGYARYFGPITVFKWQNRTEVMYEALKLFDKPGHVIQVIPWSQAAEWQREACKEEWKFTKGHTAHI